MSHCRGHPTIKFFPAGRKDDSSAIDYDGQRTAAALAEWLRGKIKVEFYQNLSILTLGSFNKFLHI
jgi:hypothetical protein